MKRSLGVITLAAAALLAAAGPPAQDWTPPSRQMPDMPAAASLSGGWRASLGAWFRGGDEPLEGVRAVADDPARPRQVRFMGASRPAASWTDRNGDGRADMIEVFRAGALAYQLIDADYDGNANVLRVYDGAGALARETRY